MLQHKSAAQHRMQPTAPVRSFVPRLMRWRSTDQRTLSRVRVRRALSYELATLVSKRRAHVDEGNPDARSVDRKEDLRVSVGGSGKELATEGKLLPVGARQARYGSLVGLGWFLLDTVQGRNV